MVVKPRLLGVVLVFAALGSGATAPAQAAGGPAAAAEGFMSAMAAKNWSAACSVMTKHTDDQIIHNIDDFSDGHAKTCPQALRKTWLLVLNAHQRAVFHVEYRHTKVTSTQMLGARVARVTVRISGPILAGTARTEALVVVREAGKWKLDGQPSG